MVSLGQEFRKPILNLPMKQMMRRRSLTQRPSRASPQQRCSRKCPCQVLSKLGGATGTRPLLARGSQRRVDLFPGPIGESDVLIHGGNSRWGPQVRRTRERFEPTEANISIRLRHHSPQQPDRQPTLHVQFNSTMHDEQLTGYRIFIRHERNYPVLCEKRWSILGDRVWSCQQQDPLSSRFELRRRGLAPIVVRLGTRHPFMSLLDHRRATF